MNLREHVEEMAKVWIEAARAAGLEPTKISFGAALVDAMKLPITMHGVPVTMVFGQGIWDMRIHVKGNIHRVNIFD